MPANIKDKEIQIQKPAQSLQAFQQKLATGEVDKPGMIKPVLIGIGVMVVIALGWAGYSAMQTRSIEKHEAALAGLLLEVKGEGTAPVPAQETEKRMRDRLPRLEALAKSAPQACKSSTEGLLATWRLELDGKNATLPSPTDPWSRIRLAQRALAIGQGQEAASILAPLHSKADPDKAWSLLYWVTLMDVHRLKGDRPQALKDVADYKARFKEQANTAQMEQLLTGI